MGFSLRVFHVALHISFSAISTNDASEAKRTIETILDKVVNARPKKPYKRLIIAFFFTHHCYISDLEEVCKDQRADAYEDELANCK